MWAVRVSQPGGVENLELCRVPVPSAGPGDVRIAVAATSLNRADLLQRRGRHAPPPGTTDVLGLECAGHVVEVGKEVRGVTEGARVMALLPGGGYAEQVVAPAELVMPVPEKLSLERAACVPEAFLTASEVTFEIGRASAGAWVLVHAAAGGVGSAAVQLAKAEGARVIATAGSDEKVARVRALGADVVVQHRTEDLVDRVRRATRGGGVDVVLDFIGRTRADDHLRCLAEEGRWVVIGLLGGARADINLARVLSQRITIAGFALRSRKPADKAAIVRRFEGRFRQRLESGEIEPLMDRSYPLARVREAHERMENNLNVGKIVLRVAERT